LFAFVVRRLLQLIVVMFVVSTVVFVAFRLLPGNPALLALGLNYTKAAYVALEKQMGLSKPLYVQYGLWLYHLVQGNLGTSSQTGLPVLPLVLSKAGITLVLAVVGLGLGVLVAIPIGVYSAVHAGKTADQAFRVFSMIGYSMPSYWLGVLLMLLFAVKLGILPAGGYQPMSAGLGGYVHFLILPACTVALMQAAPLTRFLRASMLDILHQDFVRTARSKGLSERVVIYKHVLRNALVPLITVTALNMGSLIGGLVVTEQVYAWPGIGWELVQSIGNRDYNVVEGIVLISAFAFVTANLLADILYAVVDPRITYQ
jgi:peptide/nickel transport system permease protein